MHFRYTVDFTILEKSIRPLQIDFLFPVLVKQTLACGRAANSIMLLKLLHMYTTIHVLYISTRWTIHVNYYVPQLHMQHFNIAQVNHRARLRHEFTSVLDFNNHVIVYLENVSLRNNGISGLTKIPCGRRTGNRKSIWSGQTAVKIP